MHFALEISLHQGVFLLTDNATVSASAIAVVVHEGVCTTKCVQGLGVLGGVGNHVRAVALLQQQVVLWADLCIFGGVG